MHDPEETPLDAHLFGSEQQCFGCGPQNPTGWRLRFFRRDDAIITRWVPTDGQAGPPGIFHGGLQATLADELGGWTIAGLRGRMGFTRSLQMRYIRPIRLHEEILAVGRIVGESPQQITVKATLCQNGKTGSTARMVFFIPDSATAEHILQRPLDPSWKKFCTDDPG